MAKKSEARETSKQAKEVDQRILAGLLKLHECTAAFNGLIVGTPKYLEAQRKGKEKVLELAKEWQE